MSEQQFTYGGRLDLIALAFFTVFASLSFVDLVLDIRRGEPFEHVLLTVAGVLFAITACTLLRTYEKSTIVQFDSRNLSISVEEKQYVYYAAMLFGFVVCFPLMQLWNTPLSNKQAINAIIVAVILLVYSLIKLFVFEPTWIKLSLGTLKITIVDQVIMLQGQDFEGGLTVLLFNAEFSRRRDLIARQLKTCSASVETISNQDLAIELLKYKSPLLLRIPSTLIWKSGDNSSISAPNSH